MLHSIHIKVETAPREQEAAHKALQSYIEIISELIDFIIACCWQAACLDGGSGSGSGSLTTIPLMLQHTMDMQSAMVGRTHFPVS